MQNWGLAPGNIFSREEQEKAVRKMIFFVLFHVSHLPKVVRSLSQSLTGVHLMGP